MKALLTQEEARARRQEIAGEADFYGSMDGAGKFIRSDAVASILIMFINVIFGLGIGMIPLVDKNQNGQLMSRIKGVPVRDMRTIAETLAEHAPASQNSDVLTAVVRTALSRQIYQHINGMAQEMAVITLSPELEQLLLQTVQTAPESGLGIAPGLAEQMVAELNHCVQRQEADNKAPVLLVSPVLRATLARLLRSLAPNLHVLAYNEVPDSKHIKVVASVGGASST